MRLRIDLAYDGTDFHGWAAQPGLRTVQGVLEEWIPRVLRLAYTPQLVVAGRTDAGVHARAQVCHLDLDGDDDRSAELVRRLRRVLPPDVVVSSVRPAPRGFDATGYHNLAIIHSACPTNPLQHLPGPGPCGSCC